MGPKWNPESMENYEMFLKIELVWEIVFEAFWYHVGGFGCILVASLTSAGSQVAREMHQEDSRTN